MTITTSKHKKLAVPKQEGRLLVSSRSASANTERALDETKRLSERQSNYITRRADSGPAEDPTLAFPWRTSAGLIVQSVQVHSDLAVAKNGTDYAILRVIYRLNDKNSTEFEVGRWKNSHYGLVAGTPVDFKIERARIPGNAEVYLASTKLGLGVTLPKMHVVVRWRYA